MLCDLHDVILLRDNDHLGSGASRLRPGRPKDEQEEAFPTLPVKKMSRKRRQTAIAARRAAARENPLKGRHFKKKARHYALQLERVRSVSVFLNGGCE